MKWGGRISAGVPPCGALGRGLQRKAKVELTQRRRSHNSVKVTKKVQTLPVRDVTALHFQDVPIRISHHTR